MDIPKVLFNVHATDADQDEKSSRIVYRLEGQGADEVFRIGKYSGTIELVKALDRDPPAGVPSWNFVVQAIDDDGNGLVGYADVQVRKPQKKRDLGHKLGDGYEIWHIVLFAMYQLSYPSK